ncbi:hypothetical protein CPA56_09100 [Bombella sp. TMW2.1889]|uniref:Uncharacterized protein n=1 Tax=Bombella mellum TaxID=2039288 RepID=A0ABR5ZV51_9PROT|nr:hypothetical protein [Bombella mellum]
MALRQPTYTFLLFLYPLPFYKYRRTSSIHCILINNPITLWFKRETTFFKPSNDITIKFLDKFFRRLIGQYFSYTLLIPFAPYKISSWPCEPRKMYILKLQLTLILSIKKWLLRINHF